jgi:hypothetical protein
VENHGKFPVQKLLLQFQKTRDISSTRLTLVWWTQELLVL